MNILQIDSGILGDNSVSRRLTASIVARIKTERPGDQVIHRDLAASPLAHLNGSHLMAGTAGADGLDAGLEADLEAARAVLSEFLSADVVIIGAPMYNFSVPSQLKSWIDRILVAGTTFRYTASGVEGLANGKKIIVASTRGGHYSEGSPTSGLDHQEAYLSAVFGFIGIAEIEFVRAEGLAISPESKEAAIAAAEQSIAARGHFDIAA